MANIKTTKKDRDKIMEYVDVGLSYSDIAERMGLSKSQVGKIALSKRDGGKNVSLEKKELIQKAVDVNVAKKTFLNETALIVHNEIVDERTKHLALIHNATHININRMMKKFSKNSKEYQADMSIMDNKLVQSTLKDARESLLGKESAPAVQINQNAQSIEQLIQSIDG